MGRYSKNSLGQMCDQINRDNPNMGFIASPQNMLLLEGPLTTNLGTSGRNTRAIFNGVAGAGTSGAVELFYDRTDLAKLYNGIAVTLELSSSTATLADALTVFNFRYGHGLELADLKTPALPITGLQGSFLLEIASTSLAYKGSLTVAWKRAPVGTFPQSGPGTKVLLYGSLEAGWFGTVSTQELMDHFGFYSGLFKGETPTGVIMTGDLFWMKFAYKGRFIFVPSRPVMMNMPWDTIYNLGAVYPFEQETHYLAAGVARVRQGKLLTVQEGDKTWRLKPRLSRLATIDPLPTPMNGAVPWDSGEYWELYRHIHKTGPYGDGAWADLGAQINYASEEIILNSQPSPFTQTYTEAFNMSRTSHFAKNSYPYYRPVLEVMNDQEIIVPLEQKVYKIEGRLIAPVVNIAQDLDLSNRLQHVILRDWVVSEIPTPVTSPPTMVPLANVRTITYSTTELAVPVMLPLTSVPLKHVSPIKYGTSVLPNPRVHLDKQ